VLSEALSSDPSIAALNVIQTLMLAWLASGPARSRNGRDRRSDGPYKRRSGD